MAGAETGRMAGFKQGPSTKHRPGAAAGSATGAQPGPSRERTGADMVTAPSTGTMPGYLYTRTRLAYASIPIPGSLWTGCLLA